MLEGRMSLSQKERVGGRQADDSSLQLTPVPPFDGKRTKNGLSACDDCRPEGFRQLQKVLLQVLSVDFSVPRDSSTTVFEFCPRCSSNLIN